MDIAGEGIPFFRDFDAEIKEVSSNQDAAKNKLIARNAVFYMKAMFRAILHLSDKQVEEMTAQEYIDYHILYKEVLKLMHLPYLTGE